jgi:hypothetical protein
MMQERLAAPFGRTSGSLRPPAARRENMDGRRQSSISEASSGAAGEYGWMAGAAPIKAPFGRTSGGLRPPTAAAEYGWSAR